MRSVSALLLVLTALAGTLTACTPATTTTDPQHANAKPPGNSGASGGGY